MSSLCHALASIGFAGPKPRPQLHPHLHPASLEVGALKATERGARRNKAMRSPGRSPIHCGRQKMKCRVGMTKGNRCQNVEEQDRETRARKGSQKSERPRESGNRREASQNHHCLGKKQASFSTLFCCPKPAVLSVPYFIHILYVRGKRVIFRAFLNPKNHQAVCLVDYLSEGP